MPANHDLMPIWGREADQVGFDAQVRELIIDQERFAIKDYIGSIDSPGKLSLAQFKLYTKFTNQASEYATATDLHIDFDEAGFSLPIRINPVLSVAYNPDLNCFTSASPWIDGPILSDYWTNWARRQGPHNYWVDLSEQKSSGMSAFHDSLCQISIQLGNITKTTGIWIVPCNVKFASDGKTLVVTDICRKAYELRTNIFL